jgi:hypothetical protein
MSRMAIVIFPSVPLILSVMLLNGVIRFRFESAFQCNTPPVL